MSTVQAATTREEICRRINKLSHTDLNLVAEYLNELEYCEPNDETLAAFKEAEDLDNLQSFDSVQDMFSAAGIKC